MASYLLGVDVGTTGTKTILIDGTKRVVASSTVEYPMETPQPGWTQQDPEDWWQAAMQSIQAVLQKAAVPQGEILGVGFSGQMHGMVALDRDGLVVRPAILWNDQRTQAQCDEITQKAGGAEGLVKLTNNRMLTGYTGGKILWMKQNEPENYAKTVAVICPKDYVRYRLGGEIATDVSDASGFGLFNVQRRAWSDEAIEIAGLRRSLFQKAYESYEVAGRVSAEAAALTGLLEGLPLTAGGGDAVIQTSGSGIVRQGVLGVVLGTSGVVAMGLEGFKPNPNGELQLFCSNESGLWHGIGVTLAAGGSYRWFRDQLCGAQAKKAEEEGLDVYDLLSAEAEGAPAGCGGLVFLPYLSGERCPYPDPDARGVFFGLGLEHGHAHLNRAVMEGVTFSLRQVAERIYSTDASIKPEMVILSGGGARSALWRQMTADIFGLPVVTIEGSGEGGAFGGALVAGVGLGLWKSLAEATGAPREATRNLPRPEAQAVYERAYALYSSLYGALAPAFSAAAALR
ncbi:MAG: xylulokinase [Christensenellaceae bacterium]|jgi:xylulokinase|nr:xylulokinase [Christensenellaceae bacterium]